MGKGYWKGIEENDLGMTEGGDDWRFSIGDI
jgi:hypothetical protein